MVLYVDPAGLTGIEGMAERGGNDLDAARTHFEKNGEIAWVYEGLINGLRTDMDRVRQDVLSFLTSGGQEVLPGTADAVAFARDYYGRTDQESAERLDATIPDANVAEAGKHAPGPAPGPGNRDLQHFHDVYEPTRHLDPNVEYEASAYNLDYQPKWHEAISPTSQLRNAIFQVTKLGVAMGLCDRPYDPLEAVLKPICGDWVGMARTGRVLDQVSRCVRDTGSNQAWAAQCLQSAWTGNAADAAAAHLYRLSKSLHTASETLFQLGRVYGTAAQGAFDLADTIGSLLSAISDAAIAAAASAAVAGGSAATGVGLPVAVIAGLVGAFEVGRVIDGVINIVNMVGKFDTIISTVKSATTHFGRVDGDHPLPALPAFPALPR